MVKINNSLSFPLNDVLFVFALASEAAAVFVPHNHVICGIGKVNATYNLLKSIHQNRPALIVNLGSAGSNYFQKGQVVSCSRFIQRDMNVTGLGYQQFETPLSGISPVLEYGLAMHGVPEAVCGTGDNFEMAHDESLYNVVDMEAYALALTAMQEDIPFLCLKYISDGADDKAAEDWMEQVHRAALAFESVLKLNGASGT